jgi:4-amino-4-deoxy-L-arabinose transferase-like glycosyltransferase
MKGKTRKRVNPLLRWRIFPEFLTVLLLFSLASFLVFWKISEWQYLSYDQARDFIIIKRILVNRKFTLLGPSVGIIDGLYLPPFYYYLLAPALYLFRFHIIGPDILQAVFGLGAVVVFFFLAKSFWGMFPAVLSTLFLISNPYMLQASRHARDPHMLPLVVLLIMVCLWQYLNKKSKVTLVWMGILLGVAISLHLTAVVFLPFWLVLLYRELKSDAFNRYVFFSLVGFSVFFTPLLLFELRHNFSMSRAVIHSLSNQNSGNLPITFFLKTRRFFWYWIKLPIVFLSGTYQNALLSLRSLPISSLDKANLQAASSPEKLKLVLSGILWVFSLISAIFLGDKKQKLAIRLIWLFLLAGFAVSFLCPLGACYLYYFYGLFPFLFLLIAGAIYFLTKILTLSRKIFLSFLFVFLSLLSFAPDGLKTETRAESYFSPARETIEADFPNDKKVVTVNNIGDGLRWEKNGLEYRYLLEAIDGLPLQGWEKSDYLTADVLYLIDEGNLENPLALGGMEMEAFGPKTIVKRWPLANGSTVYRLEK